MTPATNDANGDRSFDVLVVGAGFAGLYQLYSLREQGLSVHVLEAGDDIGGTWFWNRYPGARCDVDSMSYSYSFSPELEQEWEWTEKYPTQPEILRYLNHVADRFALRADISLGTRVVSAEWNDKSSKWTVVDAVGQRWTATWVVMATGCLSTPKQFDVPGADSFAGSIFPTSNWPKDGVDLTGRRVAVIGTGSSGIQVIPLIAAEAEQLYVFQRTATFSLPAGNRPLSPTEVSERKRTYREWRSAQRASSFGVPVPDPAGSALDVPEDERNQVYQQAWDSGSLTALLNAYQDTLTDRAANDTAAEFVRSKIREIVHDPDVAETLSPRSFPFGTRRASLDTDYYATFNRPNVELVDARKNPPVEITPDGIRTSEAFYPVEVIVLATGFDAITGSLLAIDIRGRDGVSLREKWSDGPRTYLGLAITGFPNLFTITGPLSPNVLSNMVVSIEQHVEWIRDCIVQARTHGVRTVEATEDAQDRWVDHVAEVASYTLFPTADSWYMGSNVAGKPRMLYAYLGGVGAYAQQCTQVAENGYEGFVLA